MYTHICIYVCYVCIFIHECKYSEIHVVDQEESSGAADPSYASQVLIFLLKNLEMTLNLTRIRDCM